MKRLSNDLRRRVVFTYLEKGYTCRSISKLFLVSKSTVSKWVKEHRDGILFQKQSKPIKDHIRDALVLKYVKSRPLITLKQIQRFLRRKGFKYALCTISRLLHHHKISYKKVTSRYQHPKSTKKHKLKFKKQVSKIKNLFCLDETGFNLINVPRKGWSEHGKPCIYKYQKKPKIRKVTMIMVISKHGIVDYKIQEQSIRNTSMMDFVSQFPEGMKGSLLMDNLRVHHNKDVKDAICAKGLSPLYTLPYSPELNPIEEVFSVIKREVRKHIITGLEELKAFVEKLIPKINRKICFENFYKHAFES